MRRIISGKNPYITKSTVSRKTIIKANSGKAPDKVNDKMYMLYSMVMIAEGLCLDTKQMNAYEALCSMRTKTNGCEVHGELSDGVYEYYKSLGYSDVTLLPHLLYVIAKESKKLKAAFLSLSPVSNFSNESESKQIEQVALKSFLNFEIVKLIEQTNIQILNRKI